MKKFSISNVAMTGPNFSQMKNLPPDVGVEIFYEWGGARFYRYALADIFRDRKAEFSIHAPFQYINFSAPCSEKELFDYLMEPFELYHEFHASSYIIHTDAPQKAPYSQLKADEAIQRVEDRLCRFHELAASEGVNVLVENLCVGKAGYHLFSQERFLKLFLDHPELNCLIDIGHAHAQHFNLSNVLAQLGSRIKAYHLHDNDGCMDSHLPVFQGSFDWKEFAKLVQKYTPQAHMVLEYASDGGIDGFVKDIALLNRLFSETEDGAF